VEASGVIASYSACVKLTILSTLSAQVIQVVSDSTAKGFPQTTSCHQASFLAY